MVTVKLFVEGGGDSRPLRDECRKGFRIFLEKAGLKGNMPRIVACGSRNSAYDDYCTAVKNGEMTVLLIDSEVPVSDASIIDPDNPGTWKPWPHLKNRDNWDRPEKADDKDCHLMVQSMETWLLADVDALKEYYGQDFQKNSLPVRDDIEKIAKDDVLSCLENATRLTAKGSYNKGNHSFEILAQIDCCAVIRKSSWAKRFVVLLTRKMQEL